MKVWQGQSPYASCWSFFHRRKLHCLVLTPTGVLAQGKETLNPQKQVTLFATGSEKSLAHRWAEDVRQTFRTKPTNLPVLRPWLVSNSEQARVKSVWGLGPRRRSCEQRGGQGTCHKLCWLFSRARKGCMRLCSCVCFPFQSMQQLSVKNCVSGAVLVSQSYLTPPSEHPITIYSVIIDTSFPDGPDIDNPHQVLLILPPNYLFYLIASPLSLSYHSLLLLLPPPALPHMTENSLKT